MALTSTLVSGPGEEPVVSGDSVQWVLGNTGTVTWPEGSTLRLVAGPAILCPISGVPPAAPGQTVVVELEVPAVEASADVFYGLVTPDGQLFGEIIDAKISMKPQPVQNPVCVCAVSPMDAVEGAIETLQGEIKTVEWVLANIGPVPWPDDVSATLIYNTPGFEHMPPSIEIPIAEPGSVVHVGISALMPEKEGHVKAMYAVSSPTNPAFGEILFVEFAVSDFPFMDWLVAEVAHFDTISDASASQSPEAPECGEFAGMQVKDASKPFSMTVALQSHNVPGDCVVYQDEHDAEGTISLGRVTGMPPGVCWILELALSNDGTEPWPADTALACCFGTGLNCGHVPLRGEAVQAGEIVSVELALRAPEAPCLNAWVLRTGDLCFGPVLRMEVV